MGINNLKIQAAADKYEENSKLIELIGADLPISVFD